MHIQLTQVKWISVPWHSPLARVAQQVVLFHHNPNNLSSVLISGGYCVFFCLFVLCSPLTSNIQSMQIKLGTLNQSDCKWMEFIGAGEITGVMGLFWDWHIFDLKKCLHQHHIHFFLHKFITSKHHFQIAKWSNTKTSNMWMKLDSSGIN